MYFLKSLLINFLVVFFANYLLPGLQVVAYTRLPHIGEELIFAIGLGLLNALIYPVLKMTRQTVSALKIALVALILNFAAYGLARFLPIGVDVLNVEGYILVSMVVTLGSFLTNFLEMKRRSKMDLPQ